MIKSCKDAFNKIELSDEEKDFLGIPKFDEPKDEVFVKVVSIEEFF